MTLDEEQSLGEVVPQELREDDNSSGALPSPMQLNKKNTR
jgi:hypothetical protein